MKDTTCKFYEKDLAAVKDALEIEAALKANDAITELAETNHEDNPLEQCTFCKHLRSGKGYPGEYVYHCTAPGNEHIIHVDFIESEII